MPSRARHETSESLLWRAPVRKVVFANHVIHVSRWWNQAVEDQCNDRVYRIGQTKPVKVHIPMAIHPVLQDKSYDRNLDSLLEGRRWMSQNLFAPPVADDALGKFLN